MIFTQSECTSRFICIEGIDGAGKTSVAQALVKRLKNEGITAILANRNTICADTHASTRLSILANLLWEYAPETPLQDLGDHHLIHLMASWFYLFDKVVIKKELKEGHIVISDQWVYKYIARFRAKSSDLAEELFSQLTIPNEVIMLTLPPEVAGRRKSNRKWTDTDCINSAPTSFVNFQNKVANELLKMQSSYWHTVDSEQSVELIVDEVMEILQPTVVAMPRQPEG